MSPILAHNKALYPPNWPAIRRRILDRDHHRCKWCDVGNHCWGWRDGDGKFHRVPQGPLRDAGIIRPPVDIAAWEGTLHIIEIVLTVAHLDHDPRNCADDNLAALCQQCHNRYDRPHRNHTRKHGSGIGQLELGP